MIKNWLVKLFRFSSLKLFNFFDLALLIMTHTLTPAVASAIGLGPAYTAMKRAYERLEDILKRNPSLLQTEPINLLVGQLRQALVTVRGYIQLALRETGALLESAKLVDHIASPYLKQSYYTTQSGIAAAAHELVSALKAPAMLEHTTALGLLEKVNAINLLQEQLNDLIDLRGEEVGYNKALGSATAARKELEAELRNVLYTVLPALYQLAPDSDKKKAIEAVVAHLNAQLEAFRHLLPSTGSGSGKDDDEIVIVVPEEPEVPGGEEPGEGGGGEGGGEDEGSDNPMG
jgi:hypothetical protein